MKMKIGKVERYNTEKKGSFQIEIQNFDWELSIIIGALKYYLENKKLPKGTKSFVQNLINNYGKALSKLLKVELNDLKGTKELFEYLLKCPICKKPFKKISPYIYEPDCEHLKIKLCVG
jgi:hypothetical protein